jgi:hypothetical protein
LAHHHGKQGLPLLDPFGLLLSKEDEFRGPRMILVLSLALENGKSKGDRNQQKEAQNFSERVQHHLILMLEKYQTYGKIVKD